MLVPTYLTDDQVELIIGIKDRVSKLVGNITIGFNASRHHVEVMPRIPENTFSQRQITIKSRRDVAINNRCIGWVINRMAAEQLPFLTHGKSFDPPVMAPFGVGVKIIPIRAPWVGEWSIIRMDQVAIPVDIGNGVAKESQVVYRKHFCLK